MTHDRTAKSLAGSIIRKAFSILPASIYGDASFPRGISTHIVTRNDPWFFESLLSIRDLSDEIIIVDFSEDPYLSYNHKIIERLSDERIRYVSKELNILEARRLAKSLSTKEIILHWDADMIAFDSGANTLSMVLNNFCKISKSKKFLIFFPIVTFFGDLDHILSPPFHTKAWVFSNTRKEIYSPRYEDSRLGTVLEGFHPPLYFRKFQLHFPLAVHMNLIMPTEKLVQKHLQKLWMNSRYREKYGTFQNLRDNMAGMVKIENQYQTVKYSDVVKSPLPQPLTRFMDVSSDAIIDMRTTEIVNSIIPD